jgi:hypothetical protein
VFIKILIGVVFLFAKPVFAQSITTENMAYFETVVNHSNNKLQSAGLLLCGVTIAGYSTVAVISGINAIVLGAQIFQKGGLESLVSGPSSIVLGGAVVYGGSLGLALGASLALPAINGLTLSDEEKRRIVADIQSLKNQKNKNAKVIIINHHKQIVHDLR